LNSASNSLRYSTMKSPIIVHLVSMHKVFLDSPFKNLYFVVDHAVLRILDVLFRIPDPTIAPSRIRIPDPGGRKAPDPGSDLFLYKG
jgi:hypothetical protein